MNLDANNNLTNLDFLCEQLSDGRIPLESIGDPNFVDHRGYTLLLLATIKGDLNLVRALASRSDVICSDCRLLGANGDPLHMAVKFQHYKIVQYLLEERGAQLDACDSYGHTPLYYSIETGSCAIFGYLLANGASLDCGTENPMKLAVNSLNTQFIELIMRYVTREHLSSYCPFSDLAYSYCALDLRKKLKMFECLLTHPKIRWRIWGTNEQSLGDLVKRNKFRFLRLLIAYHYDVDKLNLDELFARNLSDSSYCAKLLAVLKLTYHLGFKFMNVHPAKCESVDFGATQQFSSWNARNPFFGDPFVNNDKQELVTLDQTLVYPRFLHWKSQRPTILSLKQIARIALRKHFGPHLTFVLRRVHIPPYLENFLSLDDLQDYLEALDYA